MQDLLEIVDCECQLCIPRFQDLRQMKICLFNYWLPTFRKVKQIWGRVNGSFRDSAEKECEDHSDESGSGRQRLIHASR